MTKHVPGCRCVECWPPVERKPRLTIETHQPFYQAKWTATVWVDDFSLRDFYEETEPEARAAAQAYVDELLAHFREGGT